MSFSCFFSKLISCCQKQSLLICIEISTLWSDAKSYPGMRSAASALSVSGRTKCQSTSCDQLGAGWRFRKQEWWRKSTVRRLLAGQLGAAWQQHWRHRPLAWRLKSGPASSKQPLAIRKQATQNSPLLDQKQTIDWLSLVYHGIANSTPMSHPIMSSVL